MSVWGLVSWESTGVKVVEKVVRDAAGPSIPDSSCEQITCNLISNKSCCLCSTDPEAICMHGQWWNVRYNTENYKTSARSFQHGDHFDVLAGPETEICMIQECSRR